MRAPSSPLTCPFVSFYDFLSFSQTEKFSELIEHGQWAGHRDLHHGGLHHHHVLSPLLCQVRVVRPTLQKQHGRYMVDFLDIQNIFHLFLIPQTLQWK